MGYDFGVVKERSVEEKDEEKKKEGVVISTVGVRGDWECGTLGFYLGKDLRM